MGHMFANVRGGEAKEAPRGGNPRRPRTDDADDEEGTSSTFEILHLPFFFCVSVV